MSLLPSVLPQRAESKPVPRRRERWADSHGPSPKAPRWHRRGQFGRALGGPQLCAMTSLGNEPSLLSVTRIFCPGWASICVTLNFIESLATIATDFPDSEAEVIKATVSRVTATRDTVSEGGKDFVFIFIAINWT